MFSLKTKVSLPLKVDCITLVLPAAKSDCSDAFKTRSVLLTS